jgi:hypothetical protein
MTHIPLVYISWSDYFEPPFKSTCGYYASNYSVIYDCTQVRRQQSAQGKILLTLARAGAIRTVQTRVLNMGLALAGTARAMSAFSKHAFVPLNVRGEGEEEIRQESSCYPTGTSSHLGMSHRFMSRLEVYVWAFIQLIDRIRAKHIYVHMHVLSNLYIVWK